MGLRGPSAGAGLQLLEQFYGDDPLADRESDLYRAEFVTGFVDRWDELIDWDARARSEGPFFIDVLRGHGKHSVLDVATEPYFFIHVAEKSASNGRLLTAGFDLTPPTPRMKASDK